MKKIVIIIAILIVGFSLNSLPKKMFGGMGYFKTSYLKFDFTDLNNELENLNNVKEDAFAIGGGGFSVINNLILGGEGYGIIFNSSDENGFSTYQEGGMGFFKTGYIVLNTKNFMLSPLFGIGGGGMKFTLAENSPDFDDLISFNENIITMDYSAFVLDFSLKSFYKTKYLLIGFELGYLLPVADKWYIGSNEISNFPDVNMQGFHLDISTNFGKIFSE